jgi:2-(1,2-epoxy-1,2-dihydrophenyl)acetyl-CoA isomerase
LQPDWGGSYFLPRLVGLGKALELIFTGEMVGALEAGRLGIFNRVVPDDRLMAEVFAMAEMLSAKPPLALALAKRAIRHQTSSLAGTLNVELDHQMQLFKTHDVKEGVDAFLEKRSPTYQGR